MFFVPAGMQRRKGRRTQRRFEESECGGRARCGTVNCLWLRPFIHSFNWMKKEEDHNKIVQIIAFNLRSWQVCISGLRSLLVVEFGLMMMRPGQGIRLLSCVLILVSLPEHHLRASVTTSEFVSYFNAPFVSILFGLWMSLGLMLVYLLLLCRSLSQQVIYLWSSCSCDQKWEQTEMCFPFVSQFQLAPLLTKLFLFGAVSDKWSCCLVLLSLSAFYVWSLWRRVFGMRLLSIRCPCNQLSINTFLRNSWSSVKNHQLGGMRRGDKKRWINLLFVVFVGNEKRTL